MTLARAPREAALACPPAGIVFYQDLDLRYAFVLGGRPPLTADAVGRTDADLFPPADAARLEAAKRRALETRAAEALELRHGEGRFELVVGPWLGAGGEALGVSGHLRDVTERAALGERRALDEDALHQQFRALAAIFDPLRVIVYVADLHTHELLFLNDYARELFGQEALGRRCYHVLQKAQDRPCDFCTNHLLVRDGRPLGTHVWEFQNTVTGRWFLCVDQAVPWVDGRLVRMEVAVDISERKDADAFRQQYVELLSHDLRTPLGIVLMSCHNLLSKLRPDEADRAQGLRRAIKNAERIQQMVQDLADSAQLEAGRLVLKRSPHDLEGVVRDLVAGWGPEERARIQVEAAAAPVQVLADRPRLERILQNLIGNALKYSPAGALVTVSLDARATDVEVTVTDRGPGIAAAEVPRLFERFYRAGAARGVEGLGLGLYITKLLVEAHGGRAWVESAVRVGSRFRFTLPLAGQAATSA